jgi:2-polyprenyl-3-methyl-5-hydroxy-6-metoxy-1,4-benzoquinol methylase
MNKGYYQLDRSEMLELIQTDVKTALDVGCGEGNFGKLLKEKFGAEVWGFEPVSHAYQIAKENLDHVQNSIFAAESIPDKKFDLITFNDVLEHMVEPGDVLRQCLEKLTTRGQIVASIPNILYFHDFFTMVFSKDWKYEPAGIFDKTHLRFFTRKSIVRLFEESGYEVVKLHGIRPTDSKKFLLFNIATLGNWEEMKYLQFAVSAKPR